MVLVTLREAAEKLPELFESALNGEIVVIVGDDQRALRLTPERLSNRRRRAGSAKGQIWMSDDFDAPLDDFAEYME